MADTQWPRYQVFVQEQPGETLLDAGSVHAPDPELALLNARDVFARRPECAAMWVIPAALIYSRTREELSNEAADPEPQAGEERQRYYIFSKTKPAGTMTLTGEVQAEGPALALKLAREAGRSGPEPFAWWVAPAAAVVKSDPQDAPSFYDPAREKTFRMSTEFHTVSAMRRLKSEGQGAAAVRSEAGDGA